MNIRKIRKELGLSQMEFAKLLNVHQTAVSQWETGRTLPETEMLFRIARISGKSVGAVLDDTKESVQTEHAFETVMPDDGMLGARIKKGDSVYYRPEEKIENGAIAVCETADGISVRYIFNENGRSILTSACGEYAPIVLSEEDKVLGRVYAFKSIL